MYVYVHILTPMSMYRARTCEYVYGSGGRVGIGESRLSLDTLVDQGKGSKMSTLFTLGLSPSLVHRLRTTFGTRFHVELCDVWCRCVCIC